METELTDGELGTELVNDEGDLVSDIIEVHLDSQLLHIVLLLDPEADIHSGSSNHVILGEL